MEQLKKKTWSFNINIHEIINIVNKLYRLTLYLICGLTLLLNAICNLMAAFYLTILLSYEANQHPAVDEMRNLIGYKPKKIESQP